MEHLYLGINGNVVCIKKSNGNEVWRTKIKSGTITNVYYEDNHIYAHSGGYLFCLKAANGKIKWENSLKGLGYGSCIIASEQQNSAFITNQIAQQASAAAGIAATGAASGAASS